MRYGTKAIATGILIVLVSTGGAMAVGYERYNAETPSKTQVTAKANGKTDICTAIKNATFVEKAPAVLDEVAAFVKDVLAQFGLTPNKGR